MIWIHKTMFHLIGTIFDDDTIILRVCLYLRHIITCEFQRGVGSQKCVMDTSLKDTASQTHPSRFSSASCRRACQRRWREWDPSWLWFHQSKTRQGAQLGRGLMTIAEGLVRQAGPLFKDDNFKRLKPGLWSEIDPTNPTVTTTNRDPKQWFIKFSA